MRKFCLTLAIGAGLGLGALAALPSQGAEQPDNAKIAKLVQQLGSAKFDEREQASKELDALGTPALEALRKAARSDDAETAHRAQDLVQQIEKRSESERTLQPTRVTLTFKDTPIKEAVAELAKQSRYPIVLVDPEKVLEKRKVTLETGEATFWKAFDALCDKANLVETSYEELYRAPGGPRLQPLPPPTLPAADRVPPGTLPVVPPAQVPPRKFSAPPGIGDGRDVLLTQPPGPFQPGGPLQPVPPVPGRGPGQLNPYHREPGVFYLMDGKPKQRPTCYVGAVRFRALKPDAVYLGTVGQDEISIPLEVSPEPKLAWQEFLGLQIDKALDDAGQSLSAVADGANAVPGPPVAAPGVARLPRRMPTRPVLRPFGAAGICVVLPVRLKKGDKPSRSLSELTGSLGARVRAPLEKLIAADDLLKAAGKTFSGSLGGEIKVLEVVREESGDIRVKAELEYPPDVQPAAEGNGVTTGGRAVNSPQTERGDREARAFRGPVDGMTVLDVKGKSLPLVISDRPLFQVYEKGRIRRTWTLTVKAEKESGEPAQLVFAGTRPIAVEIPFTFKGVPLE